MDLQEYLKSDLTKFDEIYHLASIVGPAGVLPHRGKIVLSMIGDAYAVANRAIKDRAKLVFVSTSEVYGGGDDGLCSENTPLKVAAEPSARLEYAAGKLAAEIALRNLSADGKLKLSIVRPFNIAGPRQQVTGGFVLPRFIKAALANEPLTVFGDGYAVRALTDVRDVANGLRLAMWNGGDGEIYNIGSIENKTTIFQLASKVIKATNSKSIIKFIDPKTIFGSYYAEAQDKFPAGGKAYKQLGWSPVLTLDGIIKSTVDWTRERKL